MTDKMRTYGHSLMSGGSATVALFAIVTMTVAGPLLLKSLGIAATSGTVSIMINRIVTGADIALTIAAIFGVWTGAAGIAAIGVRAILRLATTKALRDKAIPQIVK